jgi:hypothetical protein
MPRLISDSALRPTETQPTRGFSRRTACARPGEIRRARCRSLSTTDGWRVPAQPTGEHGPRLHARCRPPLQGFVGQEARKRLCEANLNRAPRRRSSDTLDICRPAALCFDIESARTDACLSGQRVSMTYGVGCSTSVDRNGSPMDPAQSRVEGLSSGPWRRIRRREIIEDFDNKAAPSLQTYWLGNAGLMLDCRGSSRLAVAPPSQTGRSRDRSRFHGDLGHTERFGARQ